MNLNCRYFRRDVKTLREYYRHLHGSNPDDRIHKKAFNSMTPANLAPAVLLTFLFFAGLQPSTAESPSCGEKLTPGDRQHCEEMFAHQAQAGTHTSQLPGGWRLVRTPDPRGGPDAVSVLHAADTARSDLNLAGLTLRCSQTSVETLLVVLEPLARGSQYAVLVKSGSAEARFEAKALQGGEMLLLPAGATALAGGAWQREPELSIDIATPSPIHGYVPLGGLSSAMQALSQNCPTH
jgi:hypothetical protein